MKVFVLHARLFAEKADAHADEGSKESHKESAARLLMKCFQFASSDRNPLKQSKKWVLLDIINNLFKIYFKVLIRQMFNTSE